jgi:hypothetical protein
MTQYVRIVLTTINPAKNVLDNVLAALRYAVCNFVAEKTSLQNFITASCHTLANQFPINLLNISRYRDIIWTTNSIVKQALNGINIGPTSHNISGYSKHAYH